MAPHDVWDWWPLYIEKDRSVLAPLPQHQESLSRAPNFFGYCWNLAQLQHFSTAYFPCKSCSWELKEPGSSLSEQSFVVKPTCSVWCRLVRLSGHRSVGIWTPRRWLGWSKHRGRQWVWKSGIYSHSRSQASLSRLVASFWRSIVTNEEDWHLKCPQRENNEKRRTLFLLAPMLTNYVDFGGKMMFPFVWDNHRSNHDLALTVRKLKDFGIGPEDKTYTQRTTKECPMKKLLQKSIGQRVRSQCAIAVLIPYGFCKSNSVWGSTESYPY